MEKKTYITMQCTQEMSFKSTQYACLIWQSKRSPFHVDWLIFASNLLEIIFNICLNLAYLFAKAL